MRSIICTYHIRKTFHILRSYCCILNTLRILISLFHNSRFESNKQILPHQILVRQYLLYVTSAVNVRSVSKTSSTVFFFWRRWVFSSKGLLVLESIIFSHNFSAFRKFIRVSFVKGLKGRKNILFFITCFPRNVFIEFRPYKLYCNYLTTSKVPKRRSNWAMNKFK